MGVDESVKHEIRLNLIIKVKVAVLVIHKWPVLI